MKVENFDVSIDWSISTVVALDSGQEEVAVCGCELERWSRWNVSRHKPALNWTSLEPWAEESINWVWANECLELLGVIIKMIWEIWDGYTFWLFLSNLAVEKESLYADTEIVVCNDSSVLCFPVDGPERIDRNRKVSICTCENSIGNLRESDLKSLSDFIVDHICNSSYEKDFEGRGKVWPDITPDFNVDIISVKINNNVDRV